MAKAKAPRVQRTDEQKSSALLDIGYEVAQCVNLAALRQRTDLDRQPGPVSFALLEAQLLHARALIAFFARPPVNVRESDMLLDDFTPDSAEPWVRAPHDAVDRLADEDRWKLLNRHLSHLSWDRTANPNPQWAYAELANDLLAVAWDWADYLLAVDRKLGRVFRLDLEALGPRPLST